MTNKIGAAVSADSHIIVVGTGISGVQVVKSLRENGFRGRISLIGEEIHMPYDRPPLSKTVLVSEGYENKIFLVSDQEWEQLDCTALLGQSVARIDREGKAVELADGQKLNYDILVLATGSSAREIAAFPRTKSYVHYLRTLDDAIDFRTALEKGKRLLVIGGGVIGLEVAASCRELGVKVTVVDNASRLMARATSEIVSSYLERRHVEAGVTIKKGTSCLSVTEQVDGSVVCQLSDGTIVTADLVLVGIGVLPNSKIAQECGLVTTDQGIVVNEYGQTSDSNIYAAGEVAHYGGGTIKQETWAHAVEHGGYVGCVLAAGGEAYRHQPSYWSDQYDINLQVIGLADAETNILRGNSRDGSFIIFHIEDQTVRGVSAINAVRELRKAKKLLDMELSAADLVKLANTGTDLREFVS